MSQHAISLIAKTPVEIALELTLGFQRTNFRDAMAQYRDALIANHAKTDMEDQKPVLAVATPNGQSWLLIDSRPDEPHIAFAYADLGYAELGYVSLDELAEVFEDREIPVLINDQLNCTVSQYRDQLYRNRSMQHKDDSLLLALIDCEAAASNGTTKDVSHLTDV